MIPFGAQLIGQTEKALNAVLCVILDDFQLSEVDWVTLKLTAQFDERRGSLSDFIAGQAQFARPFFSRGYTNEDS